MQCVSPQQCRVCFRGSELQNLDKVVLIRIGENEEQILIQNLLVDLIRIEINESDKLPKFICTHCIEQLVKAYLFKQQCLQAYSYFENTDEGMNEFKEENDEEEEYQNQEEEVFEVPDSEDDAAQEMYDELPEHDESALLVCLDDSDREELNLKDDPGEDDEENFEVDLRRFICSYCPRKFITEQKFDCHMQEKHLAFMEKVKKNQRK